MIKKILLGTFVIMNVMTNLYAGNYCRANKTYNVTGGQCVNGTLHCNAGMCPNSDNKSCVGCQGS